MNTFFYAAAESKHCQDVVKRLKTFSQLRDLTALPCGSRFTSFEALRLRSGDLIFLFADNEDHLEELIALRSDFEGFRIILILLEPRADTVRKSHLLRPRFIVGAKENWDELEAIVDKIIFSECCRWLASAAHH